MGIVIARVPEPHYSSGEAPSCFWMKIRDAKRPHWAGALASVPGAGDGPAGTDGASETDHARLMTRDAMIGTALADGLAGAFIRTPA